MQLPFSESHKRLSMENENNSSLIESVDKNLIFSYKILDSLSSIVLTQQETNFSLSMDIEKQEDVLWVKSFNFKHPNNLAEESIALCDAAMIEIVLEGLKLLFSSADKHKALELFFMLPQEEANHLTAFDGFLESCTSQMTAAGKRVTFTLYCFPECQAQLLEKSETIKAQVRRELWKAQRYDKFLKNYLQNYTPGKVLPGCQTEVKEESLVSATTLSFEPRANK